MRSARIAVVFALLVAGGAFAEDLSGKLAELESGASGPSDKVQIVPGVDQPRLAPTSAPDPEPEPEPAAGREPEPGSEPDEDPEAAEVEDELGGESLGGGTGLTVEPQVQNTTDP